jgi:hypothetical protein
LKKSYIDRELYELSVLERKVVAYEKVRKAINELGKEFLDDPYCLEVLNNIDRAIFHQMAFIQKALIKKREKLKQLGYKSTPGAAPK